jgi:plastocyanin
MVPTARPRPASSRPARAPGRAILSLLLFATGLPIVGCSSDFEPDEARDIQTVRINPGAAVTTNRYPFSPSPYAVNRQTLIHFFNADTTAHQIAHIGGTFEAETPVQPGETWSHLFTTPGSYRYYCVRPNHREEGVIHVLQ